MKNIFFRDFAISLTILAISFTLSLILHTVFNMNYMVPSFFVLSVFLIAIITRNYLFGIVSAIISVMAVNYAFTFPYFELNFSITDNLVSAIIMIILTVVISTLTIKIKNQENVRIHAENEKMRANLLRAVSHDLRTPLTSIYAASSTISENYEELSDERKLDMMRGIEEDAQWLIRMVENLLSVTRIDSNDVKLIKSSVVLEELIDCVLSKFMARHPKNKVNVSLPEEFVIVSADPILIEQVLINLLENAVHHAVGMTELNLNVYLSENKAVFEVVDDGCGVSKEKLKHIFEGSINSDNSSEEGGKQGMGIGLSVCSSIVNAHGGKINALNNAKGKGMKFSFSLDVEEVCDE